MTLSKMSYVFLNKQHYILRCFVLDTRSASNCNNSTKQFKCQENFELRADKWFIQVFIIILRITQHQTIQKTKMQQRNITHVKQKSLPIGILTFANKLRKNQIQNKTYKKRNQLYRDRQKNVLFYLF